MASNQCNGLIVPIKKGDPSCNIIYNCPGLGAYNIAVTYSGGAFTFVVGNFPYNNVILALDTYTGQFMPGSPNHILYPKFDGRNITFQFRAPGTHKYIFAYTIAVYLTAPEQHIISSSVIRTELPPTHADNSSLSSSLSSSVPVLSPNHPPESFSNIRSWDFWNWLWFLIIVLVIIYLIYYFVYKNKKTYY